MLVESPISSMMISSSRKFFGIMVLVESISFFSVFSFKTSRSNVCLVPLLFVIFLILCPLFLLAQEPRKLFNVVRTPEEALPFCTGETRPFPPQDSNRYVLFRPTETGLGNRLLALISCYALSLVTGRKLLVDWQLSRGFGSNFWSLFQSSDIEDLQKVLKDDVMSDNDYDFLNLVYCRHCSIRFHHPNYAIVAGRNMTKEFQKKFVIVRSNVYFAPALFANPFHRRQMCSEFKPSVAFYDLFHRLLKLNTEIEAEVERLTRAMAGKSVIGLQIRLEDRVGFPRNRVGDFFNCVQNVARKYNDSIIYIAGDTESLKKKAKTVFGARLYASNKKTRTFSDDGIKAALVDLIVLSRSQELILTPFSTFGAVAAGIGNVVPHFVTRNEGFCIKDLRSEPKFHYWHALSLFRIPGIGSSDMLNQDDAFM
jgi:hypothetical protein